MCPLWTAATSCQRFEDTDVTRNHLDVFLRTNHVRQPTYFAPRSFSANEPCQASLSVSSNRGIRGPPRDGQSRGGVLEIEDTDVTRYRPRTRNYFAHASTLRQRGSEQKRGRPTPIVVGPSRKKDHKEATTAINSRCPRTLLLGCTAVLVAGTHCGRKGPSRSEVGQS